jgi:periplasmic protein TonB
LSISYDSWDDAVFEYRNRDYGAYVLRYNYPYHLTVSALIVIALFLFAMFGLRFLKEKQTQISTPKKIIIIDYAKLAQPPPIEQIKSPPKTTIVVQKKIQKYVAPKVTVEEVKEEEEMPTIEEVNKNLGTTNTDAQGTGEVEVTEVITPPPVEAVVDAPPLKPEPVINIKPPEFPGGDKALAKWLVSHMEYPPVATRMGIQGSVTVEFTVDVKGKISDIAVVQSLHRACDNEAIRLIKAMPAWIPGESNEEKVVAKRKLPIPFVLN